jgi:hypothetical protein
MKIVTKIEENNEEGMLSLISQRITLFCVNYIYTGDLVGVSDVQVKLDNPAIVYETGAFSDKTWKDVQALPRTIHVRLSAVESYDVVK